MKKLAGTNVFVLKDTLGLPISEEQAKQITAFIEKAGIENITIKWNLKISEKKGANKGGILKMIN